MNLEPKRLTSLAMVAVLMLSGRTGHAYAEQTGGAVTILDPRVLLGAAALLVAGLLCLLYFYRQRLYIRYWILGLTLAAVSPFLIALPLANKSARFAIYGISQFVGILSALVFVISADAYRTRPRLRRGYAVGLLPVLIWCALAPLAVDSADVVHAPGHLMVAGAFAAAGVSYLGLMRRTRLLGAGVIGGAMLTLTMAHAWWAFGPASIGLSNQGTFLNLTLYLAMALGMQLMTFEDMTYELRIANRRLEAAQGELQDLVTRDALTGCRNRRFFDEVIGREMQRHQRYDIPLSLMFVDVNRFKAVNDTLGHEAGDRVLQRVAAFLVRNVREADYVFRWGGDEFLILISCRSQDAVRKAGDLQRAFRHSGEGADLPEGVGLSAGCVEVPAHAVDITPFIKEADERMYRNKRG